MAPTTAAASLPQHTSLQLPFSSSPHSPGTSPLTAAPDPQMWSPQDSSAACWKNASPRPNCSWYRHQERRSPLWTEPGWSQTAMDSAVMPSTTKRSSGEHGRLNLTSIYGIHHGMTVVTDQRQIRSSGH